MSELAHRPLSCEKRRLEFGTAAHAPAPARGGERSAAASVALCAFEAAGGESPDLARVGNKAETFLATVLFADLRRFCWLSSTLGPAATLDLVDEFFCRMLACLRSEGCSFIHLIGDAVMAVFGLELSRPDEEDRAVRAAIAMQRSLRRWNAGRTAAGLPSLQIGIGINTDLVAAGCVGAPDSLAITVIGDGVNVAARLEKASKHYGIGILITDLTRRRLAGRHLIRFVDTVVFDGRKDPIDLFEVLDQQQVQPQSRAHDLVSASEKAIDLFRQRRFAEAASRFDAILAVAPDDGLARHYAERCQQLLHRPPVGRWQPITLLPSG